MIRTEPARHLSRTTEPTPAQTLRALADAMPDDAAYDSYGEGAVIEDLEREVAALLGKEAAVFCTSGKAAQLSALRVHADRRGRDVIAAHPRSHIVEDENDAIGTLYGLRVARVGSPVDPFTLAEFAAVHEPLAAVVVELPLRRTGYRVPAWDELVAIAARARDAGAAFHLDGARLWETAPGYGRTIAEIAALADTVYVSFYKGLGGIAGAALAGDAATIAAARVWIGRAGATLFRMYPYAVAAREGLRRELPRMPRLHARAVEIAAALRDVPGVAVSPDPPACNAFVVHVDGVNAALLAARDAVAASRGIIVFQHLTTTAHPHACSFEFIAGTNALELGITEIRDAIADLVRRANPEPIPLTFR